MKVYAKTKGSDLENCAFILRETSEGNLFLDAIYSASMIEINNYHGSYSYGQVLNMSNFVVNQKNTIVKLRYKTGKGLIKAIRKHLHVS